MGSIQGGNSSAFGKGKSESRSRASIPAFLRPFIEQGVNTGTASLARLDQTLGGAGPDGLVAPLNAQQELAQTVGTGRALGGGGFFPTAMQTFLDTAQGRDIGSFLPQVSIDALSDSASGANSGVPAEVQSLIEGKGVSPETLDSLQRTAGGEFLHGGAGFDQAVQAAVRAAAPGILSTFGRSGGTGAATGGLAQTAIAQAGIDAFANQFANERQNQLDASQTLADVGLTERGLDINSAGILAGFEGDERNRSLTSAGILADLGENERTNQLNAAQGLPGIATADIDLLSSLGRERQDLEQMRLTAPIDAELQLLSAALGGVPISSLIGNRTSTRQKTQNHAMWASGGIGFGGG